MRLAAGPLPVGCEFCNRTTTSNNRRMRCSPWSAAIQTNRKPHATRAFFPVWFVLRDPVRVCFFLLRWRGDWAHWMACGFLLTLYWRIGSEFPPPRWIPVQDGPIRIFHLVWTDPIPATASALDAMRDAFWDTAPSYGGRAEIWMALRTAVDASRTGERELASAILEAAQIAMPASGDLSVDGAFDVLGNRYVVPIHCLIDPPTPPPTRVTATAGGGSHSLATPATTAGLPVEAATPAAMDDETLSPPLPPPISASNSRPIPMAEKQGSLTCATGGSASTIDGPAIAATAASSFAEPTSPSSSKMAAHASHQVAPLSTSSSSPPKPTPAPPRNALASTATPFPLQVRLSTGATIALPQAQAGWTAADVCAAVSEAADGGGVQVRMLLYLGGVVGETTRLQDLRRTSTSGPVTVQAVVRVAATSPL
ncbi:hypothetical protein BC828DRAFT_379750 [Blastocladiella britannica]|nr:hypothetical protein BC828DRAFT_379750 [Blastocladiella britannica]